MYSFGKNLIEIRKQKKFSQRELAKLTNISYVTIGKYERDEMIPSVEVARKLSNALEIDVAYLLTEDTSKYKILNDPKMMKRYQDILSLPDKEKECLLTTIDNLIKAAKISTL